MNPSRHSKIKKSEKMLRLKQLRGELKKKKEENSQLLSSREQFHCRFMSIVSQSIENDALELLYLLGFHRP